MIMGQTSHAIKHAQNHLKNREKILVWVNMANFGLQILGNILKYGSGLNVLINECKSCEISNQMFFNVIFHFQKKRQTGYDINIAK